MLERELTSNYYSNYKREVLHTAVEIHLQHVS